MLAPILPRPTIPSCAIKAPSLRQGLGPRDPMGPSRYGSSVTVPHVPPAADAQPNAPAADALVIFGITGDLAKKMTLKALYDLWVNGTLKVPVFGVARKSWSHEDLRQHARDAVTARAEAKGEEIDEDAFSAF